MDRLKELHIDRTEKARGPGGGLALAILALLLVAAAGAGWWWYRQTAVAEVRLAAVEQTAAGDTAAATVLDASGYVTARLQATVSSKITGKIVEVLVEEGMEIEEDQLLARLDDATASRQLALAEAELAAARRGLAETEVRAADAERTRNRLEKLVAGAVSSQAQLDTARANHDALRARLELGREQVAVAESRVELRRQQLDDTYIRAPFDGVAVTKNAQPGEMISPVSAGGGFTRTGVCTLVDMSSLEIEVDVNEAYIGRVKPGQRVTATLDAYPDWRIPASVIIPVPTADRQKATVMVRIGFEELDSRILPDMGVRVSFLSEEQPASTDQPRPRLTVPEAALRRDADRDVVYVALGEVVERRAVKVGGRAGGRAEIEAGLAAGDRVVIEGPEDLADGDRVVERRD